MNLVLFAKEFRQHGAVFAFLFLLTTAGVFLATRAISAAGASGSIFSGAGFALITFLPIASAVIAHRLVVLEFQRKTNLFLESLPLPRWRMILTKLLLGWSFLLACAATIILLPWFLAESEARSPRFLAILLSRALLWASFAFSFFFLTSFLGRYRIPLYLFAGLGILFITSSTPLRTGTFPPFALIDPARFAFERDAFPSADLLRSALLTLAIFSASFALGLLREGSVASMLGERMSHREKLFFGGTFAALLMIPLLVDHHHQPPFHLPGALEEELHEVRLFFSPEELSQPVDRELALATRLAQILASERDWLGIHPAHWPPIFIVERPSLASSPTPFEPGTLEKDEGALIYAAYRDPSFPDHSFAHFVSRQCLRVYSRGRIDREEKRWVFEGFQLLGELRESPPATLLDWENLARQTLTHHPLSAATLSSSWDRYEDAAGEDAARAVSWHLLHTLHAHSGEDRFRLFLRSTLGPPVPGRDVRAVFRDRLHPTSRAFVQSIGMPLHDFLSHSQAYLSTAPAGDPPGLLP